MTWTSRGFVLGVKLRRPVVAPSSQVTGKGEESGGAHGNGKDGGRIERDVPGLERDEEDKVRTLNCCS